MRGWRGCRPGSSRGRTGLCGYLLHARGRAGSCWRRRGTGAGRERILPCHLSLAPFFLLPRRLMSRADLYSAGGPATISPVPVTHQARPRRPRSSRVTHQDCHEFSTGATSSSTLRSPRPGDSPSHSLSHSPHCFDPAPPSHRLLGTTPKPFPPNLLRSTACVLTPLCPPSLFCWLAVPLSPSFLPNPASTLLRLALTRGVCVSPLQCWVALCPSGSRWRLSLPGLRFSPPDLGGMNFSTRPWWFFFWVSNCQFQFWPRRKQRNQLPSIYIYKYCIFTCKSIPP